VGNPKRFWAGADTATETVATTKSLNRQIVSEERIMGFRFGEGMERNQENPSTSGPGLKGCGDLFFQLVEIHGFGNIGTNMGIPDGEVILKSTHCGTHNDGEGFVILTKALENFETRHIFHADIEHSEIDRVIGDGGEGFGSAAGGEHSVAALLEFVSKEDSDILFVIDNENGWHERNLWDSLSDGKGKVG
jgi:hypothetical protein